MLIAFVCSLGKIPSITRNLATMGSIPTSRYVNDVNDFSVFEAYGRVFKVPCYTGHTFLWVAPKVLWEVKIRVNTYEAIMNWN